MDIQKHLWKMIHMRSCGVGKEEGLSFGFGFLGDTARLLQCHERFKLDYRRVNESGHEKSVFN